MMDFFKTLLVAFTIALAAAGSARADEVTDTLNSALQAYEEGDISYALDELEYARQLLSALKTDALEQFLPPAPEGWTRKNSENNDVSTAMSMMGGNGAIVAADYSNGDEYFTLTIMLDSPMMAMTSGMIANAAAMGFTIVRIGREKFVDQDGSLMGLVGGRVMIQVDYNSDRDVVVETLKNIDFRALKSFEG